MSENTSSNEPLVVVTSGAEARIFRNIGKGDDIKLREDGALKPANLADEGPAGKQPPESSPRETDEATFSKQLADFLYSRAYRNDFDTLYLIADPDTMGELRPQLHSEVTSRLVLELPKTLINASVAEIEKSLAANI